jgi:hypothetical protein
MTDQKPNCRTCNLIPCPYIAELERESDTAFFIFDQIEKVGCLSHPQAREYLIKDVVEDLEQQVFDIESFAEDGDSARAEGIKQAIALIKEGVKR